MFHAVKPVLKADCSAGQSGEAIPFETTVAKAIALAKPVRYRVPPGRGSAVWLRRPRQAERRR
ncbi:hypothetical protein GCM10010869_62300 [Mesorhizobium tianshanense]|uniref:Uncharacterized protein n=1 Tax=Mesorhizobium tianshanense TaxID=39844 RepID=A0A562MKJ7_9HYPH|nr:hypothetical protein IQ26_06997 [Mesorhizobium tianshanense]GLS40633.1 hypothetical protein GCM10010869_62300 [Mesorhizobium tianshanense]